MLVGDLWVSRDTTTIQGRGRTRITCRSPQGHDPKRQPRAIFMGRGEGRAFMANS
jgi:hypothetical protein